MKEPLRITTFGGLAIEEMGKPVEGLSTRKAEALLVYLACTRQDHAREVLATLFWEEQPQEKALTSLRTALASLRKHVDAYLTVNRGVLGIAPDADIWLDVQAFEKHIQQGEYEAAVALYRGDFLEGFSLRDSASFEDWVRQMRERCQRLFESALHTLVEDCLQRGQYPQAIAYSQQLIQANPLDEAAQRDLMLSLAYAGQRSAALAQYDECRQSLQVELGVEPEEATLRLYAQIRGGMLAAPPGLPAFMRQKEPQGAPRPLFVARQAELGRLQEALRGALSGKGRVMFVVGGPGRGKTALVQEFIHRSRTAYPDLAIAMGNGQAYFGMGDPYLPFREALEMLTGEVEDRWAAGAITQEHAQRLWRLAPYAAKAVVEDGPALVDTLIPGAALHKRASQAVVGEPGWLIRLQEIVRLHQQAQSSAGAQQEALFSQYSSVLRLIASQAPLLLFLDDLQWADTGSLSLLFNLGRRIAGARLLVVGAYRPEEILPKEEGSPHPLAVTLQELQLLYGDITIDLDEVEDRQFIEAVLDSQPNRLGPDFREMLFYQTRGHALFTVELLRGLQARGDLVKNASGEWEESPALHWDALPARVEAAIAERIHRLPMPQRILLQIASIEGESFTVEALAEVQGMDMPGLLQQLGEELDRQHRLVRADSQRRVDGRRLSRCRFRHILFQRYLYQSLDPLQRANLHEQVGGALERLYGEQCGEVAGQLALHFEQAGLVEKASQYFNLAGERAAQVYADAEALAHFSRALALTPQDDLHGRFKLLLRRERVYLKTGQILADEQDILALEALGGELGPAWQAEAAICRAYWSMDTSRWDLQAAEAAIRWAQAAGRVDLEAEAYFLRYVHLIGIFPTPEIVASVERGLELARRAGSKKLEADILYNFSGIYLYTDHKIQRDLAEQALLIYRSLGERYFEGCALDRIGEGLSRSEDYAGALAYLEQARRIFHETGNSLDAVFSLAFHTECCLALGCLERLPDMTHDLIRGLEMTESHTQVVIRALVPRYLSAVLWLQGDLTQALAFADLSLQRSAHWDPVNPGFGGIEKWVGHTLMGLILADMGRPEQAAGAFQKAVQELRQTERFEFFYAPLAGLARLALARGEVSHALAHVEEFLPHLENRTPQMNFFCFCFYWSYLTASQVLQSSGDPRAGEVLARAHCLLQDLAARISDESLRRSFLENLPWHREIVALWQQAQGN